MGQAENVLRAFRWEVLSDLSPWGPGEFSPRTEGWVRQSFVLCELLLKCMLMVLLSSQYIIYWVPSLDAGLCGTHTRQGLPRGNGNGIQMVMIHEITIQLLRVCKHGLQWDQPWKAQLKEVFDRRGRGKCCLALKQQDLFPGIKASWRSAAKGIKRWEVERKPGSHQSTSVISPQKGIECRGPEEEQWRGRSWVFVAVSWCHGLFVPG